jgi:two-component system sensor histidine kinase UhpB
LEDVPVLDTSECVLDNAAGVSRRQRTRAPIGEAIAIAIAYYVGGQIDHLLGKSYPAALWPPNAVLLGILLLREPRWWWVYVLAIVPADQAIGHWAPLRVSVGFLTSNSIQSLTAASLIWWSWRGKANFSSIPFLLRLLLFAVLIAPAVAAFPGAMTVQAIHPNEAFWQTWRMWFVANALTNLAIMPAIATVIAGGWWPVRGIRSSRLIEGIALVGGLLIASLVSFELEHPARAILAALLYVPLPFLLWGALRFGVRTVIMGQLIVVLLAIHGVAHARGPFAALPTSDAILRLQLFLIAMTVPILFAAAISEERTRTRLALLASQREITRRAAQLEDEVLQRKRAEEAREAREMELRQSHEQIQGLLGQVIGAQEEERTRIARDLHDNFGQQLAGMSISLTRLERKLPQDATELHALLERIQRDVTDLANGMRDLSHELHPGVLRHAGLAAALKTHCAAVEATHGIATSFQAEGDAQSARPEVCLFLYRIAQEALHNVVRHAEARHVNVDLRAELDGFRLCIEDDGKGFDGAPSTSGGLGLRSMEERARLLRGTLTIASQPQAGTKLQVWIPKGTPNGERG